MLCDKCKRNEASLRVTRIINGVQYEQNLCSECAQEDAMQLVGMAGASAPLAELAKFFRHVGIMSFSGGDDMEMLQTIHRSPVRIQAQYAMSQAHPDIEGLGLKLPDTAGTSGGEKRANLSALRAEMASAVANEKYERAAELRDEIYRLEQELGQEK